MVVSYQRQVTGTRTFTYRVIWCPEVIAPRSGGLLAELIPLRSATEPTVMFVDSQVLHHHHERLCAYVGSQAGRYEIVPVAADENTKHLDSVAELLRVMTKIGVPRRHPVIVIGGGVCLDLVGFACSVYRRGIPYIRLPTTLLAMADAGVGVKTATNFEGHKSRVGTYYPPLATLIDPQWLVSLPERHIANGLAEILKVALVRNHHLFVQASTQLDALVGERLMSTVGHTILVQAVETMLRELEPNLWEEVLERAVDFGHAVSPVLEMAFAESLLHGEAVTVDMALFSLVSARRGLLDESECDLVIAALDKLKPPLTERMLDPALLWSGIVETTRHRGGKQRLPLLTGIGGCTFVNDVTRDEVEQATGRLRERWCAHLTSP